ncbi:RBBP9/YdeN family alpha/beta hydrolase [Corynebacterium heidelbergense]|uniref:Alpha/beta hydrolase n=1 Tax=Corynebacterium heidelbergense TaxID=2055947 RepID=A0A364V6X6_9CORY|nr:alpha/beta hydrolase [Corynebacterium heidelbergense]RAV32371.1 alpha/beta hydrolase [Corynebacterium heidelbergense]
MTTILISPGYTNSGPDHWQTLLENKFTHTFRVQQKSWDLVERQSWMEGIQAAVDRIPAQDDILMVGHSCGAVTVAQWACEMPIERRVKALILVAPADVEAPGALPAISPQAPLPSTPIPYSSLLVTSDDDPFLTSERARQFARRWQVSQHHHFESGGHFATNDGFGQWPWIDEIVGQFAEY